MTSEHTPRDNVHNLARLAGGGSLYLGEETRTAPDASTAPVAATAHEQLDYWGWQTCTEFGFYQTCEIGSICFYTQGLNLLPDMDDFCKVDYGIAQEQIARSIDATNAFYGADRPDLAHNASRIMYVNGDVDPWSGLSILKALSKDLPTLIVQGASHHAWTHPTYSTDQASVVTARRMIRQQVSAWLAEA